MKALKFLLLATVMYLTTHNIALAGNENQHLPQNCETGLVTFAPNSIMTSDVESLTELIRPCMFVPERRQEPFTLVITGNGGDVGATAALYDMVSTAPTRGLVTTRGLGTLASATIPLFLMAKKREIGPNTLFLFHQVREYTDGVMTTIDIHESANFNLASEKQYVAIVVKNTRLTAEEVRKMMRDGRAVTAEEAIKMGLADKILQEQ